MAFVYLTRLRKHLKSSHNIIMRYKDLVERKLTQITNQLNVVKHHSQRGEHVAVNQTIDTIKELIEQSQTYLNNETQE